MKFHLKPVAAGDAARRMEDIDVAGAVGFRMERALHDKRTEMAAVYSSFRDVSGILTPLVGGAILLVAPVAASFAACGAGMAAAWAVAGTVHPRLGRRRPRMS